MSPEDTKHLHKQSLIETHGTVEEQKTSLVDTILATFTDPERWPMTDGDRVVVLKGLYYKARAIRETENA
jgi:hypothetical protein